MDFGILGLSRPTKAEAAIARDSFGALVCTRLTSAKAFRGERRKATK